MTVLQSNVPQVGASSEHVRVLSASSVSRPSLSGDAAVTTMHAISLSESAKSTPPAVRAVVSLSAGGLESSAPGGAQTTTVDGAEGIS